MTSSIFFFQPIYPKMTPKIFHTDRMLHSTYLIMMSSWRHQWHHTKIILLSHQEHLLCGKFQFFPWFVFRDTEVQKFPIFPTWLPHHMTDDRVIIKTFYMSSRSDGENSVSIWQAVAEENCTEVLCGQTNKQTNRQTDPNAIPSPLVRVMNKNTRVLSFKFIEKQRGGWE